MTELTILQGHDLYSYLLDNPRPCSVQVRARIFLRSFILIMPFIMFIIGLQNHVK